MIPLNKDNAKPGAIIFNKDKKYILYKANKVTFYAGEQAYYVFENLKKQKITGKKLFDEIGAKKFRYDGFIIDENIKVENKRYLSIIEEKIIEQQYKKLLKGIGSKVLNKTSGLEYVIVTHKDDGNLLLRVNNDFIFYNVIDHTYTYHKNINEGKKELIWPVKIA